MLTELASLCESTPPEVEALREALAASGIEIKAFRETGKCAPLLLVARQECGAELIGEVALYSSLRPGRLLVVLAGAIAPAAEQIDSLLTAGATDVVGLDASRRAAQQVAARLQRWLNVDRVVESAEVRRLAAGSSHAWKRVLRKAVELALYSRIPLLLIGESGTGKEEIARLVHELDTRAGKTRFVVLDCATLVPELSGSEFYGHEKGSFTGAAGERDGAFMLAHGGTLFLDEIGELPLPLQGQLLRVVQEGVYKRVGGNTWRHTTFRLICATNRDLAEEVKRGRFREDLFYRISGWTLRLPPLRERREDIVPLAEHFLGEYAKTRGGGDPASLSTEVRSYLAGRDYPGNARELRHVVGRLADLHVGSGPITLGDLAEEERSAARAKGAWYDEAYVAALRRAVDTRTGLKNIVRMTRKLAIEAAAEQEGANVQRMADKLLVSKVALYQQAAKAEAVKREPEARSPRRTTE